MIRSCMCFLVVLLCRSCHYVHVPRKAHTDKVGQNKRWWKVHALTATQVQSWPSASISKTWQNNVESCVSRPLFSTHRHFNIVRGYEQRQLTRTPAPSLFTPVNWSSQFHRYHDFPLLSFPIPPNPSPSISSHFPPFPKRLSSRNTPSKIKMPARKRTSELFAPIGSNSANNAS